MSGDIEDILERALSEGIAPAEDEDPGADDVEELHRTAEILRAAGRTSEAEADASMPIARARFARFVAAQPSARAGSPGVAPAASPGWLERLFGGSRLRVYAAATAALAVVVLAALLVPVLFGRVDTATAQVLVPGDYVEFEGVAGEALDGIVAVDADFGGVDVILDDATAVVDATGAGPGLLESGRHVVVAGVVGDDLRVRARTVAVSERRLERPERRRPQHLDRFRDLTGRIVAVSFADAGEPRIVLAAANNVLFVVRVDAQELEDLLQAVDAPVGATVRVTRLEPAMDRVFGLEIVSTEAAGTPPTGRPVGEGPQLLRLNGVVTGRTGVTLTIETPRGPVDVRLTLDTRFAILDPGVLLDEVRGERVLGRFVSVTTIPDSHVPGRLLADTVIVGRPAGERVR